VTQPFGPGELIRMVRAATAPMLFGCPIAMMHWPTLNADGRAEATLRYWVVAVVVTVIVTSARAPGLPLAAGLALAPRFAPAPGARPCTTNPLADSDVTLPLAPPNPPRPNAPPVPLGRGRGLKLGRGDPLPPDPPPNPPNPPPNPAAVQLPLTGELIVTLVAVTDLVPAPLPDALPDPLAGG
jgi:hypothetical protein